MASPGRGPQSALGVRCVGAQRAQCWERAPRSGPRSGGAYCVSELKEEKRTETRLFSLFEVTLMWKPGLKGTRGLERWPATCVGRNERHRVETTRGQKAESRRRGPARPCSQR